MKRELQEKGLDVLCNNAGIMGGLEPKNRMKGWELFLPGGTSSAMEIHPFPSSSHGPYLRKGPCRNLLNSQKKYPSLKKICKEKKSQQHHRISEIAIEVFVCFFKQKNQRALNFGKFLLENGMEPGMEPIDFQPPKIPEKSIHTPP